MSLHLQIFACLIVLGLSACKSDTNFKESQLYGKWEMDKAVRKGDVTNMLDGSYFLFKEDGIVHTNIDGEEVVDKFLLRDNKLIQSGKINTEYRIAGLTEDSLCLKTVIYETPFEFYLIKNK